MSSESLILGWEDHVDECESGYMDCIEEYDNDIYVRSAISRVLSDEQLAGMPEMAAFREKVEALDQRFRECLSDQPILPADKYPWWRVYPPRIGGEDLAADILRKYGVRIEVVRKYPRK
ncbi:hypothetical protein SAMN05421805_1336 [Saccharopolyspora antimicrobica]|uniref:Uncharacterized protein n=1 Tax=Saccharopolyspora antimicrobica TaxID=455193 RepID=A0A1I5LTY2_9PSEU|nr:hypothetical protein [Saccharopolyspora antimicrobica]RKT87328.1 hypothetical protein ATL45_5736 [Saccharopolyspora antimicrobica]SFP00221.1 hypothetical protein SAMN05421805_1336 [Saccharopolyspora antimicrobica]